MSDPAHARPAAAPPVFPYPDHRSMAEVMAAEARPARQWCVGCQRDVTMQTAATCRSAFCPVRRAA